MDVGGVVLIHGGNHSSTCWDAVLGHLVMPAVAADLPGRGSRPAELADVSLTDCVEAVIDAADQAAFERFVLVGHSLGGVTITETAWRHPTRIAQLIYIGALVPPPGASAAVVQTGADLPAGEVMPDESLAKTLFGNDLTETQWVQYWETSVPDAAGIFNARLSGYPDGIPMTYVSMTDDIPVPPQLAQQMIANLGADVEHRVLSAGHTVMVSKPKELAAIINDAAARCCLPLRSRESGVGVPLAVGGVRLARPAPALSPYETVRFVSTARQPAPSG